MSVLQACSTSVSYKSVPQECPTRVSPKSDIQECPTRVSCRSFLQGSLSHKSVPGECPTRCHNIGVSHKRLTRVSHKSDIQECPTRVSHKTVSQVCPTRASYKSDKQECPTRVSRKSALQECPLQECPTRVSYKSVPQECPTRVSHKSVLQRVSHKSGCQTRFPTRVHKSVPQRFPKECVLQECPTKVFPTRGVKNCWAFVFECVFTFGFVGSILFLLGSSITKRRFLIVPWTDERADEQRPQPPPTTYQSSNWATSSRLRSCCFSSTPLHRSRKHSQNIAQLARKGRLFWYKRFINKLIDHSGCFGLAVRRCRCWTRCCCCPSLVRKSTFPATLRTLRILTLKRRLAVYFKTNKTIQGSTNSQLLGRILALIEASNLEMCYDLESRNPFWAIAGERSAKVGAVRSEGRIQMGIHLKTRCILAPLRSFCAAAAFSFTSHAS